MPVSDPGLYAVDWATLPVPEDDGAAAHLAGARWASMALPSTAGGAVDLSALRRLTVVYVYPATGVPGVPMPEGWDAIPGARGCTPQSCAFRDHAADLRAAGADAIFGLSAQTPAEQAEAAARLHLPFPLLSDAGGALARAMGLPTFPAGGRTLLRRLTAVLHDGVVVHLRYPVFPPDADAGAVRDWLAGNAQA